MNDGVCLFAAQVYFNPADYDAFVAATPKKYKETRYVQIKDYIYTYE